MSSNANHEAHPEQHWIWKYVFSVDHKVIGLQYLITSWLLLLFGFCLIMLLRWQLAFPGQPIPIIGALLASSLTPGGIVTPALYNQLGAMHGTIMIFLG